MATKTVDADLNWCQGCANEREYPDDYVQTLPAGWVEGDVIPDNVTVHGTPNERAEDLAPFIFKYGRRERVQILGVVI